MAPGQIAQKIPEIKDITSKVPQYQLPYYKQLLAFDDCLTHNSSFDEATGRLVGSSSLFWDSVRRIMPLYEALMASGELNERRMDDMVSLLRNGLRVHRWELTRLRKNLDKDVNSPLQQLQQLLQESLVRVGNDIVALNTPVKVSSRGVTNLFKAYRDIGLAEEAGQIWNKGKNNPELYELFTAQSVLGSVFSIFVDNNDFDMKEISRIYERIKHEMKPYERMHGELQVSMVRACLLKNQNEEALKIFTEITTDVINEYKQKKSTPPARLRSYMTSAHLSFIGYCQDYETAKVFFNGAIGGDLPYSTPLQIAGVKQFMQNTWNNTKRLDLVTGIWLDTWRYYEKRHWSNSSVSSSLNDVFLQIFFHQYPHYDAVSAKALQQLLKQYHDVHGMDEPFFNCLLTRSMPWKNTGFFKSIVQAAQMYHFPKTSVFYRCALKASGSVELSSDEILKLFNQLLDKNVEMGARQITNADWFALRDATVRSQHVTPEKIDLYFKLWKLCSPYFLSLRNLKLYSSLDMKTNRAYGRVFRELDQLDTTGTELPQLRYFRRNRQVDEYQRQHN